MLAGQRRSVSTAWSPATTSSSPRTQLRILAASFKQDIPVGAVTDLSIPGAGGPIRARHYRPVERRRRTAAGLLSRRRPGHRRPRHPRRPVPPDLPRGRACTCCRWTTGSPPSTRRPPDPTTRTPRYRWALDHAAELGADPGRVAVGGDSAGGNLAALVSLRARDEGIRLPALQLLIYPVTNYSGETRSQTLFADGFFLTKQRYATGSGEQFLDGAQVDADRPAGVAAAGRRPVRAAAGAGADRRVRPAARRGQAVRATPCARPA